MISELTILMLVHGLSILCGVFVGYKIAMRCVDLDLKYDNDVDIPSFEPEDIAEPLLSKIFPSETVKKAIKNAIKKDSKFDDDTYIKPMTQEDIEDNGRKHAFYD